MNPVLQRLFYRALPLAGALGILMLLRWSGAGVAGEGAQSTTIAIGFMLMAAFVGGKLAARVRLPRITGYLLVGVLVGPYATRLLTTDMLMAARTIEGIAVALIALTAGGEIRLDWVRKHARSLAAITFFQLSAVGLLVAAVVFAARSIFPFVPDDDLVQAGVVAVAMAAMAISNSPTVTIAVIAENHAAGPLSRTVLGIVVIKEVCVIVLFATMLAVARGMFGQGTGEPLAWTLTRELGLSVVVGVLFGVGIALFLRFINRDTPVFVLGVCFAMAEVAEALQLQALLIALAAGVWVENFSSARGEHLIKAIGRVSLPVLALFFAAAGAKVNLGALATMGPLALLIASVRAFGIWLGTRLGTSVSQVEPVVRRYAWLGLISQAGVTLALASILARTFPEWGDEMQVVIIAMIGLHEMIGPVAFQVALRRAGEIGAAGTGQVTGEVSAEGPASVGSV